MQYRPTVIRGNASEILALSKSNTSTTKGVDSTVSSIDAVQTARELVEQYGSVVCISGETDVILDDKKRIISVKNGHSMMTKVTGLGCSASALIAAVVAVVNDRTEATTAAMALLGIVGELSERTSSGPGSLQMNILDKLYSITETEFNKHLKVSMA